MKHTCSFLGEKNKYFLEIFLFLNLQPALGSNLDTSHSHLGQQNEWIRESGLNFTGPAVKNESKFAGATVCRENDKRREMIGIKAEYEPLTKL